MPVDHGLSELLGPGSVRGSPNLPTGFTDQFRSVRVDTGRLEHHVVIGGEGPPLPRRASSAISRRISTSTAC